jgi:hypothetical protein
MPEVLAGIVPEREACKGREPGAVSAFVPFPGGASLGGILAYAVANGPRV